MIEFRYCYFGIYFCLVPTHNRHVSLLPRDHLIVDAENTRCETHRAEETGATLQTRDAATLVRAGSKVKTIAYNWHMKFKGEGWQRVRVERPTVHSIYPRCSSPYSFLVLPPRWKFTFPPCCWNCLFIPFSFKEPLVAIPLSTLLSFSLFLLSSPYTFVNPSFAPPATLDTALREARSTSSYATLRQSSIYGEITLRWPIIENMPSNNTPELFVGFFDRPFRGMRDSRREGSS